MKILVAVYLFVLFYKYIILSQKVKKDLLWLWAMRIIRVIMAPLLRVPSHFSHRCPSSLRFNRIYPTSLQKICFLVLSLFLHLAMKNPILPWWVQNFLPAAFPQPKANILRTYEKTIWPPISTLKHSSLPLSFLIAQPHLESWLEEPCIETFL